ncbi:hypothetical protein Caka_3103 [Coraliomargarita akajimensis DSM 45221]|uniref:Uncharacterized protein n=1 Tax=Coraliomargarita akajimensis (strain DSM 45221 / IAM 15411 / JCM 23193 / KCTC 12865 / 04OKA010-24) TaxID=583355 RepID=D5EI76_CORAD|nr:hypothetical protein Caka_3103 [Coraliomargarita akajimensis DSM 45221]
MLNRPFFSMGFWAVNVVLRGFNEIHFNCKKLRIDRIPTEDRISNVATMTTMMEVSRRLLSVFVSLYELSDSLLMKIVFPERRAA